MHKVIQLVTLLINPLVDYPLPYRVTLIVEVTIQPGFE